MTLTVEIAPELESQLREQATRQGLDAVEYIVNTLREHLSRAQNRNIPHLPEAEALLLKQINEGLPQETWRRYHELMARRRAEALTPDEQAELVGLSDRVEQLNARRIECLAELARRRQMSLPDLMEQLGIKAPPYV